MPEWLREIDHTIFFLINGFHSKPFDLFFFLVSFLANEFVLFILLFLAIFLKTPKERLKKTITLSLICIGVCFVLTHGLKANFDRYRPSKYFYELLRNQNVIRYDKEYPIVQFIKENGYPVHIVGTRLKYHSFPSGHTAAACITSFILIYFFNYSRFLLFGIVLLVGYSRIYVGVHFPVDVVAGLLIGTISAFPLYIKKADRKSFLPAS